MTIFRIFATSIAYAVAVGLFAPSVEAQSISTGIFGGGLARQVLDQQDAERHRAEGRRYEIYQQDAYRQHSEAEHAIRVYEAQRETTAAHRARTANVELAHKTPVAPVVAVAKLDGKLTSDPASTTEAAKTSTETITAADTAETTTADSEVTAGSSSDGKRVCRRFSATIAALVDAPCE